MSAKDPANNPDNPALAVVPAGTAPAAPAGGAPVAAPEPAADAPPTRPDWLDPKFETPEAQAKAYTDAERQMHETRQQLGQLKGYADDVVRERQFLTTQLAELQAELQELKTPKEPEWKPEEIDPELWLTEPQKAAEIMLKNTLAPVNRELQDLRQERELTKREKVYESDLVSLQKQVGEQNFQVLYPIMQQVVKDNPHMLGIPKAAEAVLNMAIGIAARNAPPPGQSKAVDKAKLAEDPEIANLVLQKYAKDVKAGAPPVVIGSSQPGGQPPASPQNKPKSLKEATANIMARFAGK